MIKKFLVFITIFAFLIVQNNYLLGTLHLNIFYPYDINLRPEKHEGSKLLFTAMGEFGLKAEGKNEHGHTVNILQLWQKTQSSLAMLKGFAPNSDIAKLEQKINIHNDDGIRGHFLPFADFDMKANIAFSARYFFPHNISLALYLPFCSMKVKNVKWEDQTKDINKEDERTKAYLTDDFFNKLRTFDPKLNLFDWEETGLGDFTIMLNWLRDFPQAKPLLRNVQLDLRSGISFPTGVKKDVDNVLSIPFGNDGSFGIIFGGGLDLGLSKYIIAGVDAEFLYLTGNTAERRVKTDRAQTDFLLLKKTTVYKDFGFTQRFNLHLQAYKIAKGLSFNVAYQYWKHNDDKLFLTNNNSGDNTSDVIINTAKSLEEWTIHQAIFNLTYDFNVNFEDSKLKPQLSLFYKLPFKGQNCILVNTIGLNFAVEF